MSNNQKGIAPIAIILIVIGVLVIGGVIYFRLTTIQTPPTMPEPAPKLSFQFDPPLRESTLGNPPVRLNNVIFIPGTVFIEVPLEAMKVELYKDDDVFTEQSSPIHTLLGVNSTPEVMQNGTKRFTFPLADKKICISVYAEIFHLRAKVYWQNNITDKMYETAIRCAK